MPWGKFDLVPRNSASVSNISMYILFCFRCFPFRYDNGKTFVVKDTERFATEVVPDYFKHNNFSSFVRQLNFYGFRKIKSGSLRIKDAETSEESKYWKFRHEKFQRGRPDLLSQIRKNSSETADKQEVEQLRCEIRDLKDALSTVNDDVAKLKALVGCLASRSQDVTGQKHGMSFPQVATKKRKVMAGEFLMPVQSNNSMSHPLKLFPSTSSGVNASWLDMNGVQSNAVSKTMDGGRPISIMSEASLTPLPIRSNGPLNDQQVHGGNNAEWADMSNIKPASAMVRSGSIGASSIDEDVLSSLLALDNDDDMFFEELDSRPRYGHRT